MPQAQCLSQSITPTQATLTLGFNASDASETNVQTLFSYIPQLSTDEDLGIGDTLDSSITTTAQTKKDPTENVVFPVQSQTNYTAVLTDSSNQVIQVLCNFTSPQNTTAPAGTNGVLAPTNQTTTGYQNYDPSAGTTSTQSSGTVGPMTSNGATSTTTANTTAGASPGTVSTGTTTTGTGGFQNYDPNTAGATSPVGTNSVLTPGFTPVGTNGVLAPTIYQPANATTTPDTAVQTSCSKVDLSRMDTTSFWNFFLWVRCYIGSLLPFFLTIAFLVFLWNIGRYVIKPNALKDNERRTYIIAGLVGLFVIVTLWGIVSFVSNTLGLGAVIPQLPYTSDGSSTTTNTPPSNTTTPSNIFTGTGSGFQNYDPNTAGATVPAGTYGVLAPASTTTAPAGTNGVLAPATTGNASPGYSTFVGPTQQ